MCGAWGHTPLVGSCVTMLCSQHIGPMHHTFIWLSLNIKWHILWKYLVQEYHEESCRRITQFGTWRSGCHGNWPKEWHHNEEATQGVRHSCWASLAAVLTVICPKVWTRIYSSEPISYTYMTYYHHSSNLSPLLLTTGHRFRPTVYTLVAKWKVLLPPVFA